MNKLFYMESYDNRNSFDFSVEANDILLEYTKEEIRYKASIAHIDLYVENAINMSEKTASELYSKVKSMFTEATDTMWAKFKKWIKNIIDAIFGKVKKAKENDDSKPGNDKVKVDRNPTNLLNYVKTLKTNIINIIKETDPKKIKLTGGIFAGIAATTAGAIVFAKIRSKAKLEEPVMIEQKKLLDIVEELKDESKEIQEVVDDVNDETTENGKWVMTLTKEALNMINSNIDTLMRFVYMSHDQNSHINKDNIEISHTASSAQINAEKKKLQNKSNDELEKMSKELRDEVFDWHNGSNINGRGRALDKSEIHTKNSQITAISAILQERKESSKNESYIDINDILNDEFTFENTENMSFETILDLVNEL